MVAKWKSGITPHSACCPSHPHPALMAVASVSLSGVEDLGRSERELSRQGPEPPRTESLVYHQKFVHCPVSDGLRHTPIVISFASLFISFRFPIVWPFFCGPFFFELPSDTSHGLLQPALQLPANWSTVSQVVNAVTEPLTAASLREESSPLLRPVDSFMRGLSGAPRAVFPCPRGSLQFMSLRLIVNVSIRWLTLSLSII